MVVLESSLSSISVVYCAGGTLSSLLLCFLMKEKLSDGWDYLLGYTTELWNIFVF